MKAFYIVRHCAMCDNSQNSFKIIVGVSFGSKSVVANSVTYETSQWKGIRLEEINIFNRNGKKYNQLL